MEEGNRTDLKPREVSHGIKDSALTLCKSPAFRVLGYSMTQDGLA